MVISIWNEVCRKRIGNTQEEIFEYINGIYPEMFEPLLPEFGVTAKNVLLYLLHAYSYDSELVIRSAGWLANKKQIAELVELPDRLSEGVVHIKNSVFRRVVTAYLEIQSDRDFAHLQQNKDIYEAMNKNIMETLYDSEGLDFKDLNEKRKYKDELLEQINNLEENLRSKYEYVTFNKDEIQIEDRKKVKQTLQIEDSGKILG